MVPRIRNQRPSMMHGHNFHGIAMNSRVYDFLTCAVFLTRSCLFFRTGLCIPDTYAKVRLRSALCVTVTDFPCMSATLTVAKMRIVTRFVAHAEPIKRKATYNPWVPRQPQPGDCRFQVPAVGSRVATLVDPHCWVRPGTVMLL